MKALVSMSGGICAFEGTTHTQYVNVANMAPIAPDVAHLFCTAIDDWEVLQRGTKESLLADTQRGYHRARLVANIESCLCGVSVALQKTFLEETEDLLKTLDGRSELIALLLKAPLANVEPLRSLVEACLTSGCAGTASLLEEVREAQVPLRRVVDRWLGLPEELFLPIANGRSHVWRLAVSKTLVLKTIYATQFTDVERAWAPLVFESSRPSERKGLAHIATAVAQSLFPDYHIVRPLPYRQLAELEPYATVRSKRRSAGRRRNSSDLFTQVMKQVVAITAAVANGQDAKARKYLTDLVAAQTEHRDDGGYAVKSLCNIAQQCADMYRTDFEYECLQTALAIQPHDSYVLIQLADYFKRVGRFDDALKKLEDARGLGDESVRHSSIADVYAQMGRFDDALAVYDSIGTFEHNYYRAKGARADVLRRWGHLEDAGEEYQQLVDQGYGSPRITAGLAEIAKRQGRLLEAQNLYESVLQATLTDSDLDVFQSAFAHVLIRMGQFAEAYGYLDQVVQRRPFAFRARVYRSAVGGLLGNPDQAILDLPELGQTAAFDEWVHSYVRGLLLLMLDRYADARTALLHQLQHGLLDKETSEIVRLGAAVSFMRTKAGLMQAAQLLEKATGFSDSFGDAIRLALNYHIAVSQKRRADIDRLREELGTVTDMDLRNVIIAIDHGKWREAWQLELKTVLQLAA